MDNASLFPDEAPVAPPTKKDRRAILEGADPGICKGCGAPILWALRAGRPHPYNADGTSHFGNCPKAASFRRASHAP
jgi:hypothetical protein